MDWNNLLEHIVKNDRSHAQFLNTLSFMENAGARKISHCEDPITVTLLQLKHAAEEHRHAYYLKKQILKLNNNWCLTYQSSELLAAVSTKQYLNQLDSKACRFLKKHYQLTSSQLKHAAYLFVTYAIEVRADALYPIYQEVLTRLQSRVMVKSIILEEAGHLEEMIAQLDLFSQDWKTVADIIIALENELHDEWFSALVQEINYRESV